jgi:hypothetical protein
MLFKGIRYSCRIVRERLKVPGNKRGAGRLRDAHLNPQSLRMPSQVVLQLRGHTLECSHHIRNKKENFLLHKFISNIIIS